MSKVSGKALKDGVTSMVDRLKDKKDKTADDNKTLAIGKEILVLMIRDFESGKRLKRLKKLKDDEQVSKQLIRKREKGIKELIEADGDITDATMDDIKDLLKTYEASGSESERTFG